MTPSPPPDCAPDSSPEPVESPCVQVCTLDAGGICLGCGRTLEEIARWTGLSADEQRRICRQAALRRSSRAT